MLKQFGKITNRKLSLDENESGHIVRLCDFVTDSKFATESNKDYARSIKSLLKRFGTLTEGQIISLRYIAEGVVRKTEKNTDATKQDL